MYNSRTRQSLAVKEHTTTKNQDQDQEPRTKMPTTYSSTKNNSTKNQDEDPAMCWRLSTLRSLPGRHVQLADETVKQQNTTKNQGAKNQQQHQNEDPAVCWVYLHYEVFEHDMYSSWMRLERTTAYNQSPSPIII
jgi:hypothetical protein